MGNNTRKRGGTPRPPDTAVLEAKLAQNAKERQALEKAILTKAKQAERAGKSAKSKPAQPKPRKKEWACGVKVPYPDFPLTPHKSGYWMKKIRKKTHYFGRWGTMVNGEVVRLPGDGIVEAEKLWAEQRDDLYAGRTPRKNDGSLTVKDLGDRFLTAKMRLVETHELSARTFAEYRQTAQMLADQFGKGRAVSDLVAEDFESLRAVIAKRCGPVRLGNEITRVKSVFKYAYDNGLIKEPIRYGSQFKKPGKAVMRKHRAAAGKKLFTAPELKLMLKTLTPDPQMRAVVLLGINCGLGNSDIANMEFKHLDLDGGWLNYARGKTGIARRIPLWAETVKALRLVIASRPTPVSDADNEIVFITPRQNGEKRQGGTRLVVLGEKSRADYVCREFAALLKDLKINGRKGLGFYSLRHTLASVGLQAKDRDAVKAIMGHAEGDMLAAYDETGPSDERLLAVTNHVHAWLFGKGGAK